MAREVEIKDKRTGQILRETYTEEERRFLWGTITLGDIIKVGSVWIAITILVIGFDFRLKSLETDKVIVSASIAKMVDFVKSSDTFNSSFFGTQFDNGKPINPSYIIKK